MFDNFLNMLFGPVMALSSPYNLIVLSLILTFFITLVYKYVTDQESMKSLKDDMKEIRKEMKQFKEDPKKMMELQKRSMENMMKSFKHNFKPMIITFLPLILIFGWLRNHYANLGNPAVFLGLGWIWAYIIFSLIFGILLRKLFKVH
jgi:uncharacterized membrane protein (DUF106 family)